MTKEDHNNKNECLICNGRKDCTDWIQCGPCKQWYHNLCLKLRNSELSAILIFHCPNCVPKCGPLLTKRRLKRTTSQIDYAALHEGNTYAVDKASHPHVRPFANFKNEKSVDQYIEIVDNLEKETFIELYGIIKPRMVPAANCNLGKLGMKLPRKAEDITISYITELVGGETPVEVMDVLTQQSVKPGWTMLQWLNYFSLDSKDRDRIRNVISLEILQLEFGKGFIRPRLVEDMDLVDKIWPKREVKREDLDEETDFVERPQITKYCLMSVSGSFTDFHIDFGGTSVYYTVCSGEKEFLMFPPTDHNLDLYKAWCLEEDQNFIWLPDYQKESKKGPLKNGFKVSLNPGDVFIIPSGWIHAVYTPLDSIVIGGNFITLKDWAMQFKINELEKLTKVPQRFRFPCFNKVMWLTLYYYFENQDQYSLDCPKGQFKMKLTSTPKALIINETKKSKILLDEHNPIFKEEESQSYQKLIMESLISHLKSHLELSKVFKPARKSIPFDLIGNPLAFLERATEWCNTL